MRYETIPVEVKAIEWAEDNLKEVLQFIGIYGRLVFSNGEASIIFNCDGIEDETRGIYPGGWFAIRDGGFKAYRDKKAFLNMNREVEHG